jgi:hypothetical protein
MAVLAGGGALPGRSRPRDGAAALRRQCLAGSPARSRAHRPTPPLRAAARLADTTARRHARAVSRILVSLAALAALGFGGWWLIGQGPRAPRPDAVPAEPAPARRDAARAARPGAFSAPAPSAADLQTPLGDALFRWRCTTGLREALSGHAEWPLRRVAGFCLCVADRLRRDGLREVPPFRGEGLAAALGTAEAALCRPP